MDTEPPDLKRGRRQRQANSPTLDRLPPNSPEAEQATLGCILLDPVPAMGVCVEKLKKGKETFYDLRHQTIYQTMVELWDDRDLIDIVTMQERLKAWQLLEQVGGITYLQALNDSVPSAANIEYYLDIINEKEQLRSMIRVCTETVAKLYDFEGDSDKVLDECERDILRCSEARVTSVTMDIKGLVRGALREIEDLYQNKGALTGLSTGFVDLDRMTGGLQQGQMIIIAARPSVGKTSLAMNIAENVAVTNRLPVGVFSLEMTAPQLVKRMVSCRARINYRNVQDGFLAERDFPKITSAAGAIAAAPLYIDDTGGLSVLQLRAKARRMAQQYGIKLFVIDYMQLMNAIGGKRKFESRQQEVSDISTGIKNLAKELNVPVLVLSQLNRDVEREKNRTPRLSDLRESGSIEQDADTVGFLYRAKETRDEDEEDTGGEVVPINLLIAKQRNGPTGVINLTFLRNITRFESAAKVRDEDVPEEYQRQLDVAP